MFQKKDNVCKLLYLKYGRIICLWHRAGECNFLWLLKKFSCLLSLTTIGGYCCCCCCFCSSFEGVSSWLQSHVSVLYSQHLDIMKGTRTHSVGAPWDNEAREKKLGSVWFPHSLWTGGKTFSQSLLGLRQIARQFCSTWMLTQPFAPLVSFRHTWGGIRTKLHAKFQVAKSSPS